jgi:hypothetical protein
LLSVPMLVVVGIVIFAAGRRKALEPVAPA